ncbi:MAG TPA: TadE/TadG family type IV pilus assembly protein [Rhizomicrobium sp.]|jgi:Flp pilus assembly protein TadG
MLKRAIEVLRCRRGVSAVEFAVIAPVLAVLLAGTIEICNALECRQKVISTTASLADLVAQASTVSSSDLSNIFSAGNSILYPFAASNATIVISSIVNNAANGQNTVDWSKAQNGSPLLHNTVMNNIPAGIIASGGGAIFVQVTYNYTSPLGDLIGTIPMGDTFYSRPRQSTKVTCSDC